MRNAEDALVGILGLTGPNEAKDALRQLARAGWALVDRLAEPMDDAEPFDAHGNRIRDK